MAFLCRRDARSPLVFQVVYLLPPTIRSVSGVKIAEPHAMHRDHAEMRIEDLIRFLPPDKPLIHESRASGK